MSDKNAKVWLITGSSTGFGRSLAEAVLQHGDRVVATARKPEQLDDLTKQYPETAKAVRLDVTKPQEVREAIKVAVDTFGQIDVVVNNAGFASVGAIEALSDEDVRRQFETNFFGALDVTRAVLPTLRQQRSGHILNLSSVGGFVSFGVLGIYCASKFALEGISEALSKEVAPLGIKVTIVEPGAFRTEINGQALTISDTIIDDYTASIDGTMQWLKEMDGKQPGDPAKAAAAMIQVVESKDPPLRLALGADAVSAIDAKLESVKAELDAWKTVSIDTAFEGATVGAIGG